MSTLVTNTITGLSTAANITIGSTPVVSASANSLTIRGEGSAQTSVQQGLAKCWGGSTNAAVINDSLNVASSVDNGTGQYTHNLSNAMIQDINNSGGTATVHNDSGIARYFGSGTTVSAAKLRCLDESFNDEDHMHSFVIHGDLA